MIGQRQIAFGNLQVRFKPSGVGEIVDVKFHGAADRLDRRGRVVHVIPAFGIVQPADHIDAAGGDDEVSVVEIVLLGREHRDRAAGLLAGIGGLLGRQCGGSEDDDEDKDLAHA